MRDYARSMLTCDYCGRELEPPEDPWGQVMCDVDGTAYLNDVCPSCLARLGTPQPVTEGVR